MNKFLKSVRSSSSNNKNELVKKSITAQLSNSVKEIQYSSIEENQPLTTVNIRESVNNLCTIIEALFLHGLKDTIAHRLKRVVADMDERPEPSFWAPLLIISHRQIIDQIQGLSQITTEVGQCRAWIRLALNDCLLSSYLMTMRRDSSTIKSFYNTWAYVRDSELLEVAQRLIEGVEAVNTFTLPCNSSLLNTWPLQSLFLAGIWAPTLKACPVAPCDDVAQSLNETTRPQSIPETASAPYSDSDSLMSLTPQGSTLRQIAALSEDEVLKIILSKDNEKDSADDLKSVQSSSSSEPVAANKDFDMVVGNSLSKRTGWSFDESREEEEKEEEETNKSESKTKIERKSSEPKSMEASYNALIESYNMLAGDFIKTPDIREVWQKYEEERSERNTSLVNNNIDQMEVLPNLNNIKNESRSLENQIGKIAREKGLDVQNYECSACKQQLVITNKLNVCAFTGDYFCDNCMSESLSPIPARIIHNWDFKPYPISKKALNFIEENKNNQTIDFKILNPFIYGVVEEMAHLQQLRNQLNFLRAYLYTCREPIIEELQKLMMPREYMYEHIHQYSISDLSEIQNGVLAQHLEKVVNFGKEHVFNCWLCSQKGFVCEVCNKPKALFPFDVEHVYRCDICNAVYHKGCLNSSKPCPKCERRKKREDLPLLDRKSVV